MLLFTSNITSPRTFLLSSIFCLLQSLPGQSEPEQWPKVIEEKFGHGIVKCRYSVDKSGLKVGDLRRFHPTGKTKIRAHYVGGKLHGAFQRFYSNGSREIVAQYRDGQLHGKYHRYRVDGDSIESAEYRQGRLHGRREFFDGRKLISRQDWKNGLLVQLDGLAQPFSRDIARIRRTFAEINALPADPDPFDGDAKAAAKKDPLWSQRLAALNRLRQYRYLCGLPWRKMTMNLKWITMCDAAADVCTKNGGISHHPKNPGVDPGYFALAARGARSSNLSSSPDMVRSVDMYMDDSDPSNIAKVGHRQHSLDPRMLVTAFGTGGGASAMWSFDRSRSNVPRMDAVLYPPPGFVPVQRFAPRAAFSAMMGPGLNVTSKKVDIKIWPLDQDYIRAATPLKPDYFNIAEQAGGALSFGSCVIFRCDALVVAPGRRYLVDLQIEGGKGLTYLIEFFDLAAK